ncbi:MAG: AbrB/MazE/SpoVT family DNA-binding domain-containing protein [Methanocellales archaeon]|nr:AbrB/MazE/SpoVT family DNA-binding domain-containing protein [Methanocellales archaeon]
MGINVDERGRITIPKSAREEHRIKEGDEFELFVENGVIHLKPIIPKPTTVKSKKRWGAEAFMDAGEATFGD